MVFDWSLLAGGGAVGLATAFIRWHKLFAGVVTARMDVRKRRTKRWRCLVESNAWRTACPVVLEEAFVEAHGYALSDRDIRFALGRHNSSALLTCLRRSRGLVRLNDKTGVYGR